MGFAPIRNKLCLFVCLFVCMFVCLFYLFFLKIGYSTSTSENIESVSHHCYRNSSRLALRRQLALISKCFSSWLVSSTVLPVSSAFSSMSRANCRDLGSFVVIVFKNETDDKRAWWCRLPWITTHWKLNMFCGNYKQIDNNILIMYMWR